jgi:hypothetical protein
MEKTYAAVLRWKATILSAKSIGSLPLREGFRRSFWWSGGIVWNGGEKERKMAA